ncbi:MAG TPA: hypothetical protein DD473_11385 [Planctomycetaceae bacterium]|nr:hypothetical protein [Planctomycetaceae bacterium]
MSDASSAEESQKPVAPRFPQKTEAQSIGHRPRVDLKESSTVRPQFPASKQAEPAPDALLSEAGRVFDQLRIRLTELDHREQKVDAKARELDERQEKFIRSVQQTQLDLDQREEMVTERESTVERRQQRLEDEARQIEIDQEELIAAQKTWQIEKAQQEERLRETEDEVEHLRTTRLEEIARVQQETDEMLADKRQQFEEFCQSQLEDLSHQQAQATRRLKLQEDHLERLRTQVEQQKRIAREDSQKSLAALQKFAEQNRMVKKQTAQARQILEVRVQALDREESVVRAQLEQEREAANRQRADLERDQNEWHIQRQQLNHRHQEQQDQLHRQQAFLLHQQERIQLVRTEIEDKHRDTLLLRMQIEAFRSELAVASGKDVDESRMQELHERLSSDFEESRTQVETIASTLRDDFNKLHEYLEEIKKHETATRRWMTDGLIKWEHQKQIAEQERSRLIAARKDWEAEQQSRTNDRREAEQVIRNLLDQLEEANDSQPALRERAA